MSTTCSILTFNTWADSVQTCALIVHTNILVSLYRYHIIVYVQICIGLKLCMYLSTCFPTHLPLIVVSISFRYNVWIAACSYLDHKAICEDIVTMDGLEPDEEKSHSRPSLPKNHHEMITLKKYSFFMISIITYDDFSTLVKLIPKICLKN